MDVKRLITAIIICLGVTTIPLASAAQSNWYAGFGTGNTDVDESALDDDSGTKFYGGYQFTDRYALEGGYTDLGTFDVDASLGTGDVEVDGLQVAGVASFSLPNQFSIFGKAGLYNWDSDVTVTVPGLGTVAADDDGTDVMYGFGVGYSAGNWGVRGEWERFDADDDIDMISVGVIYRH
jgi:OOP family OmpA-OmpF porin